MSNWYETREHVDALKKHLSPVTVKDMLLYFIYKKEFELVEAQIINRSFGRWVSYRSNKKVLKFYKKDLKKWSTHILHVERNIKDVTELTNLSRKGSRSTDTSLVNWFADIVTFFNTNMNTTEKEVLEMPFLAVNEYKIAIARNLANARRTAISNNNANEDTLTNIDTHIKRKSNYAREIRAENAKAAREDFTAH